MIGLRIKEERERLGMTQADFAAAAGAGKRTLSDWEKGSTYPTAAQLAALNIIHVDVMYIVSGQRSATAAAPDEQILLEGYRKLKPDMKNRMLAFMLAEKPKEKKKTEESLVSVEGNNNKVNAQVFNEKIDGDVNIS